jgi:hypothetical protein
VESQLKREENMPPSYSSPSRVLLSLVANGSFEGRFFPIKLLKTEVSHLSLYQLFDEAQRKALPEKRLLFFIALSLSLYEDLSLNTSWILNIRNFLEKENLFHLYEQFRSRLLMKNIIDYQDDDFHFAIEKELLRKQLEMSLSEKTFFEGFDEISHQAFARLFSPGQRKIIAKCLQEKALTKSEREIFSRVIKKKLQALLDENVLLTARKLTRQDFKCRHLEKERQDFSMVSREEVA